MPALAFRMCVLALFFRPIFHLKPKPCSLCCLAVFVPHLSTPCLPSGDKTRQADLHTKPWNSVFAVPSLSMKFPKKVKWRYVSGRVKVMITQAAVQICEDQVEQVQRPCVCVLWGAYIIQGCPWLQQVFYCCVVLFVKDFKTSSPCCAVPSCLCSQEFPSNLL